VEQGAAVLVEPDGHAAVIGHGNAYFVGPVEDAIIPGAGKPITWLSAMVLRVQAGQSFDLKAWKGDAVRYSLSVRDGVIQSTQAGGGVY
jgi:hypothetical protein